MIEQEHEIDVKVDHGLALQMVSVWVVIYLVWKAQRRQIALSPEAISIARM